MTRQEFYDKYGNVEVKFSSYYKYVFTYEAVLPDGKRISVGYGGNHDDIYRHGVSVTTADKIIDLQPHEGSVYEGKEQVESFYDY